MIALAVNAANSKEAFQQLMNSRMTPHKSNLGLNHLGWRPLTIIGMLQSETADTTSCPIQLGL